MNKKTEKNKQILKVDWALQELSGFNWKITIKATHKKREYRFRIAPMISGQNISSKKHENDEIKAVSTNFFLKRWDLDEFLLLLNFITK